VIPKNKDEEIVVLRGEFRGETGKILSRDKKKDEVIVQIGLTDIEKLSQDDIC
jgi:ribosomal protein L24